MLAASTQLAGAADDAASAPAGAAAALGRRLGQCARHRLGGRRARRLGAARSTARWRSPTPSPAKAVSEAERTNATVKELNEAAGRIGDVVKLITDIAEQTNLLALNATIEAARAGEAGRGFAVVASEVKALAGQTAKATEEIGAQIAGMQQATMRSIEAIGAIERTIREIGEISGAIAAAVTEQGAATQEIARSVETAARAHRRNRRAKSSAWARRPPPPATAPAPWKPSPTISAASPPRIRGQVDHFFQKLRAA